ncbi:STAS domain-containing protein [Spirillospora sp. NPDC127200]
MDDALKLSTHHTGTTLTITVTGELDFASSRQLQDCLDSVFIQLARHNGNGDRAVEQLVIDTGGIAFIDACGLGVLVALRNRAHGHRLPLLLATIPASLRRLLAITDMQDHFTTDTDQDFRAGPSPG